MLLAEKTINAKGGINGRPIKLIVEDDASNPDTALSKANDLLFSQEVVGLIGPSLTASTVAIGGCHACQQDHADRLHRHRPGSREGSQVPGPRSAASEAERTGTANSASQHTAEAGSGGFEPAFHKPSDTTRPPSSLEM